MKKYVSVFLSFIICFSTVYLNVQGDSQDILNVGFENSDWNSEFSTVSNVTESNVNFLNGGKSLKIIGGRGIVEYIHSQIENAFVEYAFYDDMSNNRIIGKLENGSNYIMSGIGINSIFDNYQVMQGGILIDIGERVKGWHKITVVCKEDESIVYLDGIYVATLFAIKPSRFVFGAAWEYAQSEGMYIDDIRIGTGEPIIDTIGLIVAQVIISDPNAPSEDKVPSKSKTEFAKKQVIEDDLFDNAIVLKKYSNDVIINNVSSIIDSSNPQNKVTMINGTSMIPLKFIVDVLGGTFNVDETNHTVNIMLNNTLSTLIVGSKDLTVDSNRYIMAENARYINGEIYVPIKDIAEKVFNKKISYFQNGLIVITDNFIEIRDESINVLAKSFKTVDYATKELFISPDGDDSNCGCIDHPLKTFDGVKSRIRNLRYFTKGTTGFVVYVRGGEYNVQNSIKFFQEDSGTATSPIRYVGYGNERPVLSGGISIPANLFENAPDDIKARLKEEAKDKVKVVDLKKLGLTTKQIAGLVYQGHGIKNLPSGTELFINNKAQIISRYPNNGFISISAVIKNGKVNAPYSEGGTIQYQDVDNITKTWQNTDNIWINGYLGNSYADTTVKVTNIDTDKKELTTQYPGNYGYAVGQYFYFMNVLEEIDMESEYYIDKENMKLYVYSSNISADADIRLSITDKPIINLDGVSFVSFENIEIGYGRGVGVNVNNSHDITIEGSTIKCFGEKAIQAANEPDDLYNIAAADRGVFNFLIKSNNIFSIGKGAILISGGDRVNLISGNIIIENNEIYEYSRLRADDGIKMYGVGNTMSYNKMYSAPKKAIHFQGNNMIVENNEIFDVCQNVNDMGAVYMGRDLTMQGNIIRNNFLHDIVGMQGKNGVHAIYCDDFSSGITAYGNLILNVQDPIMFNGGSIHNVYNNLIVNKTVGSKYWLNINDFSGTLGGSQTFPDSHMITINFKRTPYTNEVWRNAYPYLVDFVNSGPIHPKNNVVKNNAIVNHATYKGNTTNNDILNNYNTDDDILFIDAENMDYNLKPESPVFANLPNFSSLPYDEMGLYKDKYRN